MRLGDLDALKEAIETYDMFACLPDGKLYPVRELKHPEMFVAYIHVEDIIKAIDNAPTIEIPNCGGQVVPDTLQGWKYEERLQGE